MRRTCAPDSCSSTHHAHAWRQRHLTTDCLLLSSRTLYTNCLGFFLDGAADHLRLQPPSSRGCNKHWPPCVIDEAVEALTIPRHEALLPLVLLPVPGLLGHLSAGTPPCLCTCILGYRRLRCHCQTASPVQSMPSVLPCFLKTGLALFLPAVKKPHCLGTVARSDLTQQALKLPAVTVMQKQGSKSLLKSL